MQLSSHIAEHLRQVHFGGNWTCSNLRDQLADVGWEDALCKVHGFNSIAQLTFHVGYFVRTVRKVLEGGPLEGHDKLSFDHSPIADAADWDALRAQVLGDAEAVAELVGQVPEAQWWDAFVDPKYGDYFRNLMGIVEHTHYHLGQIALLKVLVRTARETTDPQR